jgi:hypothetical protein
VPTEISVAHLLVDQKLLAGARETDLAVDHHIRPIRQLQRMVGVLLDQEDGHPGTRQFAQGGKDLLHYDRRQAQARLIEQQ